MLSALESKKMINLLNISKKNFISHLLKADTALRRKHKGNFGLDYLSKTDKSRAVGVNHTQDIMNNVFNGTDCFVVPFGFINLSMQSNMF